jgi:hypothetical protein
MMTNVPQDHERGALAAVAASSAEEQQSPWLSLGHLDSPSLLGTRGLWLAGMTWLDGSRQMHAAAIDLGRNAEATPQQR